MDYFAHREIFQAPNPIIREVSRKVTDIKSKEKAHNKHEENVNLSELEVLQLSLSEIRTQISDRGSMYNYHACEF